MLKHTFFLFLWTILFFIFSFFWVYFLSSWLIEEIYFFLSLFFCAISWWWFWWRWWKKKNEMGKNRVNTDNIWIIKKIFFSSLFFPHFRGTMRIYFFFAHRNDNNNHHHQRQSTSTSIIIIKCDGYKKSHTYFFGLRTHFTRTREYIVIIIMYVCEIIRQVSKEKKSFFPLLFRQGLQTPMKEDLQGNY